MIIFNYIFNFFVWVISKLPFWFLYIISDFFYLILYYIIGYRKKIVYQNLRNSFSQKNTKEIRRIAKQNYHSLCDIILETLKKTGMSENDFQHRIKGINFELLDKLYEEKKSVLGAMGHFGNFEWAISYLALKNPSKTYVAARPLSNNFFDDFATKTRSIFGLTPYHYKKTYELLKSNKNKTTMTVIVGDQTPTKDKIKYWTAFLNQETPFHLGIEKMSKIFNLAVVYFDIYRVKRGYYQIECKLISDSPEKTKDFEIIENYIRKIENTIVQHPADWLWSHRRWKHKKEHTY